MDKALFIRVSTIFMLIHYGASHHVIILLVQASPASA